MTTMQEAISRAFARSNPQVLTLIEENVGKAMLEEARSWPRRDTYFEQRNDTKSASCVQIVVAGVKYESLDKARIALGVPEKLFIRLNRAGQLEDYISKRDIQ